VTVSYPFVFDPGGGFGGEPKGEQPAEAAE
jgi:hypothetical protein